MAWATSQKADIISLSLGFATVAKSRVKGSDPANDIAAFKNLFARVVTSARKAGAIVIAAGPDNGTNFDTNKNTIDILGSVPGVLTIGAVGPTNYTANLNNPSLNFDGLAPYSALW
jgi:hypothetical protein